MNSMKWNASGLWSLPDPAVSAGTRKRSYFSNLSHEKRRKRLWKENHFYNERVILAEIPRAHAGHLILSWTPQGPPDRYPRAYRTPWSHTGQCRVCQMPWIHKLQMSPGSMLDTLGATWGTLNPCRTSPDTQQMLEHCSLCWKKIYKSSTSSKTLDKSHRKKMALPYYRTWNYFFHLFQIMWRYWYLFS